MWSVMSDILACRQGNQVCLLELDVSTSQRSISARNFDQYLNATVADYMPVEIELPIAIIAYSPTLITSLTGTSVDSSGSMQSAQHWIDPVIRSHAQGMIW
jgi:hypothetical protein